MSRHAGRGPSTALIRSLRERIGFAREDRDDGPYRVQRTLRSSLITCSHVRGLLNWLGYCYRDGHRVWNERDYRSEDHDDQANPDPGNQRIQVRLDDGASGGFVFPFVDEVDVTDKEEVLLEAGIDAGNGLRLAAGFVEAAFRIHGGDLLAAAEDVDDGPLVGVVRIVVLRVGLADEGVGADVDLVAERHFFFHF